MSRAKPTPPERVRKRPIVRKKIWERMHQEDKNYMAIICGDTGSGKSEFGLRLCEIVDPNFDESKIAFTVEEFLELVNERQEPGSAILFDEVGIALSHAKHYDEEVIRVNHVLQSWREQNRMLIMTAPHINLIHKPDRGLLHAQMDMQEIDREYYMSRARYRNIQQNTDTGDLYKKYPRIGESNKKVAYLSLFKPSPEIVQPYLERKRKFNDRLNQEVLEQVKTDGEEGQQNYTPQKVVEEVLEEDLIEDYISTHGGNGTKYIDADLLKADFNLSLNDSKQAKKLLGREIDVK